MKRKLMIVLLAISSFFVFSCSNDGGNEIGKWEDNIKLSQKTAAFTSASNSVTITSEAGWWLNGIALNGIMIDLGNVNKLSENFIVTTPDFQVERKNGKTIIITMNQNTTNTERVLNISLQNGDYFDAINVVQAK